MWKTSHRKTGNVVTFTTLVKTGNGIFLNVTLNRRLGVLAGAVIGFTIVKM